VFFFICVPDIRYYFISALMKCMHHVMEHIVLCLFLFFIYFFHVSFFFSQFDHWFYDGGVTEEIPEFTVSIMQMLTTTYFLFSSVAFLISHSLMTPPFPIMGLWPWCQQCLTSLFSVSIYYFSVHFLFLIFVQHTSNTENSQETLNNH